MQNQKLQLMHQSSQPRCPTQLMAFNNKYPQLGLKSLCETPSKQSSGISYSTPYINGAILKKSIVAVDRGTIRLMFEAESPVRCRDRRCSLYQVIKRQCQGSAKPSQHHHGCIDWQPRINAPRQSLIGSFLSKHRHSNRQGIEMTQLGLDHIGTYSIAKRCKHSEQSIAHCGI